MKQYKATAVALAFLMLMSATASGILRAEDMGAEVNGYTVREPIRINGNTDFAAQATTEGWPGDGTEGNPYIIEGYEINGTGHGNCIYVGNTSVYFVVRGCYVHSSSGHLYEDYFMDAGVYLWNVQNGSMENNIVSNNDGDGIRLYWSSHNIIFNNTVFSNGHCGIFIYDHSEYIILSGNNFTDNRDGIYIGDSTYCSFSDNLMVGNGFRFKGFELIHFNSHNIDTSNTVNGKPVYYLKDTNNVTVSEGAGQVILVNCKGVTVENQNISNVSFGISLFYSNGNIISNNTVLLNNFGSSIRLECSDGNFIINNTLRNQNVTLLDNHEYIGINLLDSYYNAIINNSISGFSYGIEVTIVDMKYDNNDIRNNTFINNTNDYELSCIVEDGESSSGIPSIYIILALALVAIFATTLVIWKRKKSNRGGE
jgi:parallel beta-helix repeat protein